jgi:hypothetical protein
MSKHEDTMEHARDKHIERLIKQGAPSPDGRGMTPLTRREAEDRARQVAEQVDRKKREGR